MEAEKAVAEASVEDIANEGVVSHFYPGNSAESLATSEDLEMDGGSIKDYAPTETAMEDEYRKNARIECHDRSNDERGQKDTSTTSVEYESASSKGASVFELTVVNKDGSETISAVSKRARTVPPDSSEKTPDTSTEEKEDAEGNELSKPKAKNSRLYFGRDRLLFTTMAKAYIHHEIYKFDSQERWERAIDEFYNVRGTKEGEGRKPLIALKRLFLSGLESRIKSLAKRPPENEDEEGKLCHQIKELREEAKKERIQNGQVDLEETPKKRKRRYSLETRGRPRMTDIEMTSEMEERYLAVEDIRDKEQRAKEAVQDIERQIEEAQRRLEVAKVEQKIAEERAEDASAEFSADVINGTGPWKEMFVQLRDYEAIHGTANLIRGQTPEMKALRRWVLRQRERYHLRDDQKGKLPWYCARNLESIGFLWRYSDGTWMKFYNELLDYKKENGDCAVPRGWKPNPKLSQWVKRMRHEGNRFRENPTSVSMTAEQLKMLEDIGFIWENLTRSWNERFEDLKKFKAEHGHCRVPKVYPANPKLVSWCQNQRAHHRAFLLGKKTFMDAARKVQLDEVGFEWETGSAPGRPPLSTEKKKRPRKKKDDVKEESGSDDDAEEEEEAAALEEEPEMLQHYASPQVYHNQAFAYPNHAYANPYQQQQHRHFYPTL